MNTKYKNLLFDADQTLIDFEKDMPLAFQYMYEQSGLAKQKPYNAEILRLYNDCNESWWRRFEQKLCTKAELYRNRFVDFFEAAGLTPVSIDFLQDLYVSGIAKTGTPLPGALDMLRALSERYDLYITTNGNPISQPGRLKNSGVTAFMKGCFISDEIGAQSRIKNILIMSLRTYRARAPKTVSSSAIRFRRTSKARRTPV